MTTDSQDNAKTKLWRCSLSDNEDCLEITENYNRIWKHTKDHLKEGISAKPNRLTITELKEYGWVGDAVIQDTNEIVTVEANENTPVKEEPLDDIAARLAKELDEDMFASRLQRIKDQQPQPMPSMAEKAAKGHFLLDQIVEVIDEPEEEYDPTPPVWNPIEPTLTRREHPFFPSVEMVSVYDAYRAVGYEGTMADWIEEIVWDYIGLSGVDIRLGAVTEDERLVLIKSIGFETVKQELQEVGVG